MGISLHLTSVKDRAVHTILLTAGVMPAGPPHAPGMGPAMGSGGLAGIMGQLMQSPALQQMADSLMDRHSAPGQQRQRQQQRAQNPPDFGTFLQGMMPMVSQVHVFTTVEFTVIIVTKAQRGHFSGVHQPPA